ncbi:MAG: R3H domain-containing nucleic acid-binding protein [Patescibacteria group bacterium]
MKEEIKKISEELLSLLGVEAEISVEESGEAFSVNIEPKDEAGLLIGKQGETLHAIEMFLAMAIKSSKDEWVRIAVNIGDYREKQEDYLNGLAEQSALKAIETGEPQYLYNLTPTQRRTIHMHLSENSKVETLSEGEGRERFLVVKPKK